MTASRARCAPEPIVDERYVEELRTIGEAAGLSRLGVTAADAFPDARRHIEARKADGLAAEMQFTFRNPARSTEPQRALPSAQALVVGARAYPSGVTAPPPGPHGRVARYAVDDHYAALREGLEAVAARLRADGWRTRTLADDNALVDRAAAHRAAIGWFGKNANILLPGAGSWFVLGSVVTDAPLPIAATPVGDGCGACTRCIDGCPTGAIVAPGVVDARRCLAWLLQAEGDFPEAHRVALGDRIYGCDDCQEVCPPNRRARRDEPAVVQEGAWVPIIELLAASDRELLDRHGRWYIPRRDPRYLRRNALVVLGNIGDPTDPAVRATLERYRASDDPMLRRHADWATRRLGIERSAR